MASRICTAAARSQRSRARARTGERARPGVAQRLGGFASDGREYVIALDGDRETPLPWSNVIANPTFGTIVTASGSSFTWNENSRENRLTRSPTIQ
jgi:cellobiose phosphorylase